MLSGYQAIWRIVDSKLYLDKIIRCSGDNKLDKNENIIRLFQENDIKFVQENKMIAANWLNINLYKSDLLDKKFTLTDFINQKSTNNENIFLKMRNGKVFTDK